MKDLGYILKVEEDLQIDCIQGMKENKESRVCEQLENKEKCWIEGEDNEISVVHANLEMPKRCSCRTKNYTSIGEPEGSEVIKTEDVPSMQ